MSIHRVAVIDSHTGGEPTRVVVSGGPDLGDGSLADRLIQFREQYDSFRSAVVCEPRGSDVLVGALLTPPTDPRCIAGMIFFNNVGYLGMCGHGTIGVVQTLAHLGRITPGEHYLETPVGIVSAFLHDTGAVSVRNVPSFRHAKGVPVVVDGHGIVTGDIAWGGNWFFLVYEHGQTMTRDKIDILTNFCERVRQALVQAGITGADHQEIDHIELFGPSESANSRNFVLCPGSAYDRSPCGTGTSAKLACLYADGVLAEGETWRQESIIGSIFEGQVEENSTGVIPTITGTAFINGEATLLLDDSDPFRDGIR